MDDMRLIEVTKLLRTVDLEIIRKATEYDSDRKALLVEKSITEDEFAEYLSQEVLFKIDDFSIKRPRKQVIQAMHSCC